MNRPNTKNKFQSPSKEKKCLVQKRWSPSSTTESSVFGSWIRSATSSTARADWPCQRTVGTKHQSTWAKSNGEFADRGFKHSAVRHHMSTTVEDTTMGWHLQKDQTYVPDNRWLGLDFHLKFGLLHPRETAKQLGGKEPNDKNVEKFVLDPNNWIVDEAGKGPGPAKNFRFPSKWGSKTKQSEPPERIQLVEEWPAFQAMAMNLPSTALSGPSV